MHLGRTMGATSKKTYRSSTTSVGLAHMRLSKIACPLRDHHLHLRGRSHPPLPIPHRSSVYIVLRIFIKIIITSHYSFYRFSRCPPCQYVSSLHCTITGTSFFLHCNGSGINRTIQCITSRIYPISSHFFSDLLGIHEHQKQQNFQKTSRMKTEPAWYSRSPH